MFFGLRSPLAGFIEIIILWIAILLTVLRFLRISATAGILLIPYILWVSFAAVLNFSIWRLNP
jgi:tryptophan-rich sensory protein